MLYVVPTPIGNLGDITLRALDTLKNVEVIFAEDTRHTRRLLDHYGIMRPLASYHEHNEKQRTAELVNRLQNGQDVALVSDAGTPGISDPGFRLIHACIQQGLPYTILPGASALTVAAVGCGFGGGRFHFGGFLPVKSGQRASELQAASERPVFSLYFESPHRLVKSLMAAADIMPERQLCVARELSKLHEEFRRGHAADLAAHFSAHPPRGEIVLAIAQKGGED